MHVAITVPSVMLFGTSVKENILGSGSPVGVFCQSFWHLHSSYLIGFRQNFVQDTLSCPDVITRPASCNLSINIKFLGHATLFYLHQMRKLRVWIV